MSTEETLPPALPLDVIEPEVMDRRLGVLDALPETGLDVPDTLGLLVLALVLVAIGIAAHRYRR